MDIINVFYDTETTGFNPRLHTLHQIAGSIEVNNKEVQTFNFKCRPYEKAKVDATALDVCGLTEMDLLSRADSFAICYAKFTDLIKQYIDPHNRQQKAFLIGYNNRAFDDVFLRTMFELNNDDFFGSLFWSDSIDVLCLASQYLQGVRHNMKNFKLGTVAQTFGLAWCEIAAHDAAYDARKTQEIYNIIRTGL